MPFKSGKDWNGNKNGRPKGSLSLLTILKNKLETMSPDQQRTAAEVFIENMVQDGLDGNDRVREMIMNYVEGKPVNRVEISEVDGLKTDSGIFEDE